MIRRKHKDSCSVQPVTECEADSGLMPKQTRTIKIGAQALGALALGAAAFGALAIGALAVGRLVIGRSRIKRLEIDELIIDDLLVRKRYVTHESGKSDIPRSEE
jgi:hypothetical protein